VRVPSPSCPATEDTLSVLEFDAVMDGVARRAVSELGGAAIRALRPGTDLDLIRLELERVAELAAFLAEETEFAPPQVPDARAAIQRLTLEGGVLEPRQLVTVGSLLREARILDGALAKGDTEFAHLKELRDALFTDSATETRIARIVAPDGIILDSASTDLKRIRSDMRRIHGRIVQRLEAFLKKLPDRFRVPDASVTIREERYVIPIRREGKGSVGGVVHDESATGHTLFVEPPLALEIMNELRELERAEVREIQRILREVSDDLRPVRDALEGDQEILISFDALFGRARMALEWDGNVPQLTEPNDPGGLIINGGRHPLLILKGEVEVIPFDLSLESEERVVVVSGPNTGGKSVFLKALGLTTVLAQAGVVPPVGPGCRIPLVRRLYTDIGDRQSIAESLSTFSAHLAHLREIVEGAAPGTLVLVDEMGTGTDPAEGAALARAALELMVERQVLAVVTSHLGALKTLDAPGSGIVNASLQFDPERIEPTYQFVKGRPGRSYGLAIARRLGLPDALLDRAEMIMGKEEASLEELLERLEAQAAEGRELTATLEAQRAETDRLRTELKEREARVREAERTADVRASTEARNLLMEARQEVESAIQEVRDAGNAALEDVSRKARRKVEQAADRHRKRSESRSRRSSGPAPEVGAGDRVKVLGSGALGTVAEMRDGKATVVAGPLRMQVALHDLEVVETAAAVSAGASARRKTGGVIWTLPETTASPEVDLRGLRVDEADLTLTRAVDAAVLEGLNELRIIHGKGTGALRVRVGELLSGDSRVSEHRLGGIGEGGAGVTVAMLR